jgi:hypothetical protein
MQVFVLASFCFWNEVCLRRLIGRFIAFEAASHRGAVAGDGFDDHRIDGYQSSS